MSTCRDSCLTPMPTPMLATTRLGPRERQPPPFAQHAFEVGGGDGLAEQVALQLVATQLAQEVHLLHRFHPFGDDFLAQSFCSCGRPTTKARSIFRVLMGNFFR